MSVNEKWRTSIETHCMKPLGAKYAEIYQTLITSLPHLPLSFHESIRPLLPTILEDRLEMLNEEDFVFIKSVWHLLEFEKDSINRGGKEREVLQRKVVETAPTEGMKNLLSLLHAIQMIIGALRLRKQQKSFVEEEGEMATHIRRNWQHPTFRLGETFPWIEDVRLLLENDDYLGAHRRTHEVIWLHMRRLADHHNYDLTAVLLYLLRWNILRGWTNRSLEKGKKRFQEAVREGVESYGQLFS